MAIFDARGNGRTTRASDGHWHTITLCEIEPAGLGPHTHELTATRAPIDEAETVRFEAQIAAAVTG